MLKKYGPIHDIRDAYDNSNYQQHRKAIITFRRCRKIVDIASEGKLKVNGKSYPIMFEESVIYKTKCLPTFPYIAKPDTDPLQQLLSILDDDCLLEILMKDIIGIEDLLNLASTCTRLKNVAIRVFRIKYFNGNPFNLTFWTLQKIEHYFQVFGSSCKVLVLARMKSQDVILKMIEKYCTELIEVRFRGPVMFNPNETKFLFSKIRRLCITSSDITDFPAFWDSNCALEELTLSMCVVMLPPQHFQKLVDVKLHCCQFADNLVDRDRFRRLNPQLRLFHVSEFMPCIGIQSSLKYMLDCEKLEYLSGNSIVVGHDIYRFLGRSHISR